MRQREQFEILTSPYQEALNRFLDNNFDNNTGIKSYYVCQELEINLLPNNLVCVKLHILITWNDRSLPPTMCQFSVSIYQRGVIHTVNFWHSDFRQRDKIEEVFGFKNPQPVTLSDDF